MKKKILLISILIIFVSFFSGITYSFFNSNALSQSTNQGIASFVFDAQKVDHIELDLNGLVPGETKQYEFSITNTKEEKISDVTIEYQLRIKTYHFMPLEIELYKIDGENEILFGICDETSGRNEKRELICNMDIETLNNSNSELINYKLKVSFPEIFNDISYSGLVDFINLEIESWQKI